MPTQSPHCVRVSAESRSADAIRREMSGSTAAVDRIWCRPADRWSRKNISPSHQQYADPSPANHSSRSPVIHSRRLDAESGEKAGKNETCSAARADTCRACCYKATRQAIVSLLERAMEKVESEHVERRIELTKEHVPELEIAVDIKSAAPVHGDWTPREERLARLKIDFIILPLLILGFFMMQLDRGNIANALTDTILQDLKITTNDVNTRYQLLSMGVLLFEIPSNIVLQKIGPRLWITGQILAWGVVAGLQMFVKGRSTFLLTGFLIGVLESGFIPGSLYYISTWYKHDEYAVRNTAFFIGNLGATALSGVISSGILSMAGRSGLAGWQWLFMVEGVMTVGIGIVWLFLLPDKPTHASPVLLPKWKMLNERQVHILATRVIIDDAQKSAGSRVHISLRDTLHVLANWRLWQHVMVSLVGMMPAQALGLYFPSIIQSLGFPKLKANALSSVGGFGCIVFVMTLAWISDKTNRRGLTVIFSAACLTIFEGTLFALPINAGKWSKFAVVCLVQSFNTNMHTLNITWLSTNCVTVKDRAIGLPMVVMAANAAGMIGPSMMRASDAPRYRIGFTAAITLTCLCTVIAICSSMGYLWWNRKRRTQGLLNEAHSTAVWVAEVEGEIEEEEVRKRFVYTW